METPRIIILLSIVLLLIGFFFVKKEKMFFITSFINYLFVIMTMIYAYYTDYEAAVEMYILMEAGTMKAVPDIVAYINTNNLFFIGYSLIYIILTRLSRSKP